jgi:hypothetical protein
MLGLKASCDGWPGWDPGVAEAELTIPSSPIKSLSGTFGNSNFVNNTSPEETCIMKNQTVIESLDQSLAIHYVKNGSLSQQEPKQRGYDNLESL